MLGAIIGDIAGSRFERYNYRAKDFEMFHFNCRCTDDSVMSLSICKALLNSRPDYSDLGEQAVYWMQSIGRRYPHCGYGPHFRQWILSDDPSPYGSYGNGAAMRVSGCGYAAKSLEETKMLSQKVTAVSHNHPEALKGAEAVTVAIWLAREGKTLPEIRDYICRNYYQIDFTIDEIRPRYMFDVSCQGSVPQALEAFFESTSFEDAVRTAVSLGGDSDTIGAIAGSVAEAYYGIPKELRQNAASFMDETLLDILEEFENRYPPKITD